MCQTIHTSRPRRNFDEKELVDLTLAIIAINGWNRLAISFRAVPGTYQPAAPKEVSVATAGSPTP